MNLVTQVISEDADAIVLGAAAALGDTFLNYGRTFLLVDNADAAPINVTLAVQKANHTVPGLGSVVKENVVFAVPAGTQRLIAVPRGPYNNNEGRVVITYSAVANVTVAAVRVPQL
jgi:hypothetical protein